MKSKQEFICRTCNLPKKHGARGECGGCYDKRRRREEPVKMKQILRKRDLKKLASISLEDYEKMFDEQKGLCLICETSYVKALAVDHDHITGKVRGLLCGQCNLGLGNFKDNETLLSRAVEYLLKNK